MSAADVKTQPAGLRAALALLARHLPIVLAAALVGGAAAWLVATTQDERYVAEATVAVQGDDAAGQAEMLAELAASETVAANVVGNLRLDESPAEFLDLLEVETGEVPTIRIAVEDEDRQRAIRMAQEVSLVFAQLVRERFTEPPLTVTVFDAAHAAEEPVAPKPLDAALVGLGLGALLGLAAAILLEALDPRVGTRAAAERALGAPVVAELAQQPGEAAYRHLRAAVLRRDIRTALLAGAESRVATGLADAMTRAGDSVAVLDAPADPDEVARFELRDRLQELAARHDHVLLHAAVEGSEAVELARLTDATFVFLPRGERSSAAYALRDRLAAVGVEPLGVVLLGRNAEQPAPAAAVAADDF